MVINQDVVSLRGLIGQRVRVFRMARGATQARLAAQCEGLSAGVLGELELGKRRWNSDHIEAVAAALMVDPWLLLAPEDEASDPDSAKARLELAVADEDAAALLEVAAELVAEWEKKRPPAHSLPPQPWRLTGRLGIRGTWSTPWRCRGADVRYVPDYAPADWDGPVSPRPCLVLEGTVELVDGESWVSVNAYEGGPRATESGVVLDVSGGADVVVPGPRIMHILTNAEAEWRLTLTGDAANVAALWVELDEGLQPSD